MAAEDGNRVRVWNEGPEDDGAIGGAGVERGRGGEGKGGGDEVGGRG